MAPLGSHQAREVRDEQRSGYSGQEYTQPELVGKGNRWTESRSHCNCSDISGHSQELGSDTGE